MPGYVIQDVRPLFGGLRPDGLELLVTSESLPVVREGPIHVDGPRVQWSGRLAFYRQESLERSTVHARLVHENSEPSAMLFHAGLSHRTVEMLDRWSRRGGAWARLEGRVELVPSETSARTAEVDFAWSVWLEAIGPRLVHSVDPSVAFWTDRFNISAETWRTLVRTLLPRSERPPNEKHDPDAQ